MYLMFDTYLFAGEHRFISPWFFFFWFFSLEAAGEGRQQRQLVLLVPHVSFQVEKSKTEDNISHSLEAVVFFSYVCILTFFSNLMIVWGKVVYLTNNIIKIGNFEALLPLSLLAQTQQYCQRVCWQCLYVFVRAGKPTHLETGQWNSCHNKCRPVNL